LHRSKSIRKKEIAMDTNQLAILIVVVALVLIVAALLMRRSRTESLRKHFGDEYHRTVEEYGSRDKAEAELEARRKRVSKLSIVPLTSAEAARFRDEWHRLQERFVDDPHGAVMGADRLVCDLMLKRGYPMTEFETRAADISVDHPAMVTNYRAAHEIALRDAREPCDTETLRQAVVHYRALFADLLEVREPRAEREPERRGLHPVRSLDRAMARKEADSRDRPR
jgi:hypothetical protein